MLSRFFTSVAGLLLVILSFVPLLIWTAPYQGLVMLPLAFYVGWWQRRRWNKLTRTAQSYRQEV